jgi:hypothetical protein
MKYEITETNGSDIYRTTYKGTLAGAKRKATREQVYHGSKLEIATTSELVAVNLHGKWHNTDA